MEPPCFLRGAVALKAAGRCAWMTGFVHVLPVNGVASPADAGARCTSVRRVPRLSSAPRRRARRACEPRSAWCCARSSAGGAADVDPADGADAADAAAPSPAPGSRFYLALSGVCSACALAVPALAARARPDTLHAHYIMLGFVYAFALAHSGLASLRPRIAAVIGERLYRVLFAVVSLPGAGATIAYFVAHRYDGAQLWTLQGVHGLHEAVWIATFVSFLLLYPATFNLAEVAAIKRPGFRIYEEGVMRVSRHPQLWGQVLWCFAHCAWIGTSFALAASLSLVAHHLFAVWNGDRRLRNQYGDEWDAYAARTSVLPFRAIADGRQQLAWSEFPLAAYAGVLFFVLGTYAAHPAMLRAAADLHW